MPGWHEATKELQKQGKLRMVGIIQEQHPDRARLFKQWKQMDWPILVDSANRLGVSVVPLTVAIDEYGVIRAIQPRVETIQEEFLNRTYEKPAGLPATDSKPPDLAQLKAAARQDTAESWRAYADALITWGNPSQIGEVIEAYENALKKEPEHASSHFRLGVAYRKRYDSGYRQPNDFRRAVEHWGKALSLDPNQYIWRRRIQQYGPRLEKPYPFYDWVTTARTEIQARGETPAKLSVEPGGAEFAEPVRSFEPAQIPKEEPDPQGRILRDAGEFVEVETTVVPSVIAPGGSARVHVVFCPNLRNKAHWNNEVENLVFLINPPNGWQADQRSLTVPNPPQAVSQEPRTVEFEIRSPANGTGLVKIPAYSLYYVCEDVNGVCLYRRQDIPVQVEVRKPGS